MTELSKRPALPDNSHVRGINILCLKYDVKSQITFPQDGIISTDEGDDLQRVL